VFIQRPVYLRKIEPFIDKAVVKIVTGVRRCGKSVLMLQVRDLLKSRGVDNGRIVLMNFDTFETGEHLDASEVYQALKAQSQAAGAKIYVFLDEIQELREWEKLVNSCITELDADVYLTGSNSKMLSREYASMLTGRYVTINVYPFSFSETLAMRQLHGQETTRQEAFNDYLLYGGMPFVCQLDDGHSKLQYLRDVAEAIISKDITERYKVRDLDLLKRTVAFLMSTVGNMSSANNIANYFRAQGRAVSWETVSNYVEYLKTACLFLPAAQIDVSGKAILRASEKLYLTDHGFREAVYGKNLANASQVLENIVYLELRRHEYQVNIGRVGRQEVDFVAKRDGQVLYVQVCYLLASDEITQRELRPLQQIKDNYPKLILSLDPIDLSRDGIRHMGIVDFLAEDHAARQQ
jgi:predicted AAA+ superfamily ATPase